MTAACRNLDGMTSIQVNKSLDARIGVKCFPVMDCGYIVRETIDYREWRQWPVPGKASDHYERLADHYDDNWAYDDRFIGWMSNQILDRLRLGPDDRVVDLGCGTGLFSAALARHAGRVACVDPSAGMLRNLKLPPGADFVPVRASAEEIASGSVKLPFDTVDAILVKEAIHHIPERERVIGQLAESLASGGGCLLVVMLPTTIQYPLFRRALDAFREQQPDPAGIKAAMEAAGLAATLDYDSYRLAVRKDRYLGMVRGRYMSLLSMFSDEELEAGIGEIDRGHPGEVLEFEDRFAFVLGRRP